MARVNLSIDDALFAKIQKAAQEQSTTVNLLIIDLLEDLYLDTATFDFSAALKTLVVEAENYARSDPEEREFPLVKLNSFSLICVAQAGEVGLRPSMVRARLGKMFNTKVRRGEIMGVSRAKDENGENKFIDKSAVYVVD